MTKETRTWTIPEAAEELGITPKAVRKRILAGTLRAKMVDGAHGKTYEITSLGESKADELPPKSNKAMELALVENRAIANQLKEQNAFLLNENMALREKNNKLENDLLAFTKQLLDTKALPSPSEKSRPGSDMGFVRRIWWAFTGRW